MNAPLRAECWTCERTVLDADAPLNRRVVEPLHLGRMDGSRAEYHINAGHDVREIGR